jgi:hypothetical protein
MSLSFGSCSGSDTADGSLQFICAGLEHMGDNVTRWDDMGTGAIEVCSLDQFYCHLQCECTLSWSAGEHYIRNE